MLAQSGSAAISAHDLRVAAGVLGPIVAISLVAYGRWIVLHVFDDDAGAALDGKTDNAVWKELLRRRNLFSPCCSARFAPGSRFSGLR